MKLYSISRCFDLRFMKFRLFDLALNFLKNPFIFVQKTIQNFIGSFQYEEDVLRFPYCIGERYTILSHCKFMILKYIIPNFVYICFLGICLWFHYFQFGTSSEEVSLLVISANLWKLFSFFYLLLAIKHTAALICFYSHSVV